MLRSAERELKGEYDAHLSSATSETRMSYCVPKVIAQNHHPRRDARGRGLCVTPAISQSSSPYKHMRNHSSRYRSSYAPYVGSHVPSLTVVFCGLSYSASCLSFPFHIFPDHISVMKRMRTFALPALALISVCMLLGRDYITHYSQLSTGRKGREIHPC